MTHPGVVGNIFRLIDTGFEPRPVAPSERLMMLDCQVSGPLSPVSFVSFFSGPGDLAREHKEVALSLHQVRDRLVKLVIESIYTAHGTQISRRTWQYTSLV